MKRIFQFTDLAFVSRPDLFINYRLWNLINPGDAKLNIDTISQIENYFSIHLQPSQNASHRKSKRIINRLYLHFDTRFIWPDIHTPEISKTGTCHGLKSHIGILVDGTVVPCCLDRDGIISLGNLQLTSLDEILKSDQVNQMKIGFDSKVLVENLCRRCSYITRFKKTNY